LGYQEEVDVDTQVQALQEGDRFVLCSDGLSNLLSTVEIGEVVRRQSSNKAARELISIACERGGDDNITVIVTYIDSV
jgi:protein phosphatase